MTERAIKALQAVREAAAEAEAVGQVADFLGALEAIRVQILLAATRQKEAAVDDADRLLTARETAKRIGMSVWWVRTNKDALPVVRLPTGRYAFSEKALERWIQRRTRP